MKENNTIMNMKKLLTLAAGFAMTASLAACSSGSSASGTTTESSDSANKITVWCWDENFNVKGMEVAKEIYLENHPDTEIDIVNMSQDDIVQKLNTSLSSGNIDTLPNIVLIEDYRIQGYLQAYDDSFEDLSTIVSADDFVSYKMAVNTIDGKIYGVPFDSGVAGMFYRTDILEEAGYTPEDMNEITWEKYIEIAKDVKEKTGVNALTLDPSDIGQIRMMMQSAGAWYTADDGETVDIANNDVLKEGIQVWKSMIDANIVKQVADWDSFVTAFQTGEVWSVPTGCWIAPTVQVAQDLSGKWQIAELPRLGNIESSVNASSIGGAGWYVVKGLPGNETAMDFLKETFASNADLMNQLCSDISLVSTLKAAADTENYKLPNEFFSNTPIFENFSQWSEEVPSVNYGLHTYAIEDIVTEAVQAYMNGTDLDTALEQAQKQAEGAVSY